MLYAFAGVSAAALLLLLTSRKPSFSLSTMASNVSTSTSATKVPSPPAKNNVFSSLDFEVFGKVQGVYFRQHVTDKADEINERVKAETGEQKDILVGFVRNTQRGSVEGVAQSSSAAALDEFERFVTKAGSPASRIDRFEVRNRREVGERPEFEVFERRY